METPPSVPIGTSDFREIRTAGQLYVDKTDLIRQLLVDPAKVVLFPRPRRFGKTTNLSTLRYFLEKSPEDRSALFSDLAVWRDTAARAHFQRYPVIFITFKDVKATAFEEFLAGLAKLIAELYGQHRDLLEDGRLAPEEAARFRAILEHRAGQSDLKASLKDLSNFLARRHGQGAVVLIDEYDTPLHTAFAHDYFDDAVALFRGLLSGVLKDNTSLHKGVLTGILRVAKESLFSDLNNIIVYSLLHPRYAPYFGFTEPEVEDLARRAGYPRPIGELRDWYNGYLFADTVIYNPWSVLAALLHGKCDTYWVNTASNELLHELLLRATSVQHTELEALLQGETIRKRITESIALRDVHRSADALWSFLLFAGYLRASGVRQERITTIMADLSIPNHEVRAVFSDLFSTWLVDRLGGDPQVEALSRALLSGDVAAFQGQLSRLLDDSVSSFDVATRNMPPEQIYHVFVLGLLLYLQPRYLVRSNREAGFGRSDVMVLPRQPGQPGVVLELKVRGEGQSLEAALNAGLKQLKAQDYAAALRAHGAAPIHEIAVAFDGKRVLVKALASRKKR